MINKIFKAIMSVATIIMIASLCLFMVVLYNYYSKQQVLELSNQMEVISVAVEYNGKDYLDNLNDIPTRITWINEKGNVLYDNKANNLTMENHLEREEVQEALETGVGESSRYSNTLSTRQFYQAKKLSDGTVLRLSQEQRTWWSILYSMIQPILMVLVIGLAASYYLAKKVGDSFQA